MNRRLIAINAIVVITILFALEVASGYALNKKRLKKSSLLYALRATASKIKYPNGLSEKYKRVSLLQKNGSENVYPAYTFDSQVHESGSPYWFGHPPNSLVIYCNEGSGLTEFTTNKIGFRDTSTQNIEKPIDLILLGDSYAEGACVNAPDDIASILGKQWNLLNLGRGGSGPLFQLGLFKELLRFAESGEITLANDFNVVWIVFTGNDLHNLAEERQGKLSSYLSESNYSQDYFRNLVHTTQLTAAMRSFHDLVFERPSNRIGNHGYGETVTPGSISEQTALQDFAKIADNFNNLVKSKGGNLNIVVLENHPTYNSLVMKSTQAMLSKECNRFNINCLQYDLSDPTNKSSTRNHLTEEEYKKLSNKILSLLRYPRRQS